MIFTACIPAYADTMLYKGEIGNPITTGTWSMDAAGEWHYATTEALKNTWAYIANPWNDNKPAWFIFDENGKMLTGWQLVYWNGSYQYYYFHEVSDGKKGECQLGGNYT